MLFPSLLALSASFSAAHAITIYGQLPLYQTATETHPAAPAVTTLAAYNDTLLNPPPIPQELQRQVTHELPQDVPGTASIPHVGANLWGFSIEMSVISQILGKNSTHLYVPFLNLMANIVERAGGLVIRIGGNTQEFASLVPAEALYHDGVSTGRTFGKTESGSTQTTKTPAVLYTIDMFYMASNISSMLNIKWFFGIPFNDSANWRLSIAEEAQTILGDNLLALQAGNEPDFYVEFGRRVAPYEPIDYSNEVEDLIRVMDANPRITNKNMLLGPSVASGPWKPEQVWETGFMDKFQDRFYAFSVEHYPDFNCAAQFNNGQPIKIPQSVFPNYLDHQHVIDLVVQYRDSANLAVAHGKPFMMFETNTASCGGFSGVSASFGAAMWATDYGLQLGFNNFTHGMLHIGGQNVFYNPFISPPTNQSLYNKWTVGSVYYATVIVAEALGKSNTSQIVDLRTDKFTPAYAIYENQKLSKAVLFNYVTDPTGNSNISVTLNVPNSNPQSVRVKYLLADSVAARDNITWAGQTLGNQFEVDGRFKGDLKVDTIQCAGQACVINVPAPGVALVFFNPDAEAVNVGQASQTFTTTAYTNHHNTATIEKEALETSNGHSGMSRPWEASTNFGYFAGHAPESGALLSVRFGGAAAAVVTAFAVGVGALKLFL